MASASCGRLLRYACRPTSSFAFSKLRCRWPSQALHSPRNSALLMFLLSLFWRAHLACKFCTTLRSPSSSFTLGKLRTLLARLAQNFLRNHPLLTLFCGERLLRPTAALRLPPDSLALALFLLLCGHHGFHNYGACGPRMDVVVAATATIFTATTLAAIGQRKLAWYVRYICTPDWT